MAKTFSKQLLKYGSYVHPNNPAKKMVIDRNVALQLKANFERGIIDKVPAPWTHTDDASQNTGFVKSLEIKDDGIDMVVEFADDKAAEMAEKRLIPGVSAGLDFDYVVKGTGEHVGPTLLHTALVNHPYLKGMRDFEPVVTLSEGGVEQILVLSEEDASVADENELTKEDIFDVLREMHGVDVQALQNRVTELEGKASLSDDIVAALVGDKIMLSDDADPVAAIKELLSTKVALSEEVGKLKTAASNRDADDQVQVLLSEGKITPAQRDMYTGLAQKGMLTDEFVAAMPKVVDLSEKGHDSTEKPGGEQTDFLKSEIERITREAGYKK